MGDHGFAELVAAERQAGIQPYADPWTLMELVAHLADPHDQGYTSCRAALRRAVARAQVTVGALEMLAPSEVRVSQAVFGEAPTDQVANVNALVELVGVIAAAPPLDDLQDVRHAIRKVATDVAEREHWFAGFFAQLRTQVVEAAQGVPARDRNKLVRDFIRSEAAIRLDAELLVRRAYRQAGMTPPDVIPSSTVDAVLPLSRAGSYAAGLVIERVLCDNIDLDKARNRNLMWDQEVSSSVGRTIGGSPVVLVTSDSYFREAATIAGCPHSVCNPDEYRVRLGLGR
jgi:hypothetical protein